MEGLAENAHVFAVLDHLKKGGVAYVVAWPKNYPPVRQPLKNRSVVDFRTAGWRGEFLPVREEEVKGKDLKHLLGVTLLCAPIMDNAKTRSGITGTLSLARR